MSDPVEAILSEAPAAVEAAGPLAAPAPVQSWFSRAWGKLRMPSPRSDQELADDLAAQMLNGMLNTRTAGTAAEAKLGEAVMDCVYALTAGAGMGATTPLGRLFMAVKTMLGKLRSKMARPAAP